MVQKPVSPNVLAQGQHVLAERIVRVGPLIGLPALVRDLGCDPDPIFAGAGFNLAQFEDPDVEIPFVLASRLLARCVEATGCSHLGLLLGERVDPSSLGVGGFMLRAAPDVGTALRGLVRHLDLHDQGAVATLVTKGREAALGYAIYLSGVEAADQIYDLSMAVSCKIMRSLCGARWNPTEVLLSRRRSQDPAPYQQFFRAPLHFDADRSAVVFPTRWLNHPIASADPLLLRHLEQEADDRHAHQQTSFAADIRRLLRKSLATRKIAVTDIAKQFHTHERTLNRRLREEGTTFRRELKEVRYEVAKQLLADSKMPLSKISASLGYSDATAFSRGFKRWSGNTPTEWRARHPQP